MLVQLLNLDGIYITDYMALDVTSNMGLRGIG